MNIKIVVAAIPEKSKIAQSTARRYNLPYLKTDELLNTSYFVLYFAQNQLELHIPEEERPFVLSLISTKNLYRYHRVSFKQELIGRAMGAKVLDKPSIVDATAGFGKDSFILASLGYHVTMLEQSAVVYLLLQDALARAAQLPQTAPITNRLQLIHTNAFEWLREHRPSPDILYLDPMFPIKSKTAAVKKEPTLLQRLLQSTENDEAGLLKLSLSCAKQRVVVKRPRFAPPLNIQSVNFSLTGKSIRFDIYLPRGHA